MRLPKPFELSDKDAVRLNEWCRSTTLPHGQIMRAKIILQLSEGMTPTEVATAQRTTAKSVHRWRNRFETEGVDGLLERARSGRPTVIDKKTVDKVLFLTTKRIPQESTHWSIELMAQYAQVTPWQVRQIWKAADLRPHRLKTFKISNDPRFADKVVDIVGLYMNPPDNAVVLSVDEKTQIQALDRTQPVLPMGLGYVEGITHQYVRHGTLTLFAALDLTTGEVIAQCKKRHRHQEFLQFLKHIEANVPKQLDIHLVVDNYATHKHAKIRNWLAARARYHVHYTPTYSSWLNQVETWFHIITQKAIRRGSFRSTKQLREKIDQFVEDYNSKSKPFMWTATADSILAKIKRVLESISGT